MTFGPDITLRFLSMKLNHSLQPVFVLAVCFFLFLIPEAVKAQYETITYDYERNYFNQGQNLPAEEYMMMNGVVPQDVQMIVVEIFKPRRWRETPLYKTLWTRSFSNNAETFELPLNYKLRSAEQYNFLISYFKKASKSQSATLSQNLESNMRNYLSTVITTKSTGFQFHKPVNNIMGDLRDIVLQTTQYYTSKIYFDFDGFSEIIRNKLKRMKSLRKDDLPYSADDPTFEKERVQYLQDSYEELVQLVDIEIQQRLGDEMLVLGDVREVIEYNVERTRNHLAINVGYGAVFLEGDLDNLVYDSGPYVGMSFPLGNSTFSPLILSNASLSLGFFTKNFEDNDGRVVSGPIFGRPLFAALGYNTLQFLRFNAGVSFVEWEGQNGSESEKLRIQPFVGVSAEIKLWLGISRR